MVVCGWKVTAAAMQKATVLGLGFGRVIVLRLVDYQSHHSEYGTEWNFFVTLYLLWLFADTLHFFLSRQASLIFVVALLVAYQYALVQTSLTEFIFYSPREGLFSSNREGIFSIFGCLPLYIMCESISFTVFFKNPSVEASTTAIRREKKRWLWSMLGLSVVTICAWAVADSIQPTSRRLFNLAFVLLCTFVGVFGVSSLLLVEVLFDSVEITGPVKILELMNDYQLVVFFFANILTGVVNMSCRTIYQNDFWSTLILSAYIATVHGFVWVFDCTPIIGTMRSLMFGKQGAKSMQSLSK